MRTEEELRANFERWLENILVACGEGERTSGIAIGRVQALAFALGDDDSRDRARRACEFILKNEIASLQRKANP